MIATITKRFVTIGDLPALKAGQEVEVYPDKGSTLQVHYVDRAFNTRHIAYNINATWLASVAVYRRAKELGYE